MKRAAAAVFAALALAACGGAPTVASGAAAAAPVAPEPEIAAVHRAKCGACHAPILPGERDRATIEAAMRRHRNRLRLTDARWHELVAWLAPAGEAPKL